MFRYTVRELLWLMLVVAIGSCWWIESARARQWRQRAEIAAGQLEAENFGRMVFENTGVRYESPNKDPQFREVFYPTGQSD